MKRRNTFSEVGVGDFIYKYIFRDGYFSYCPVVSCYKVISKKIQKTVNICGLKSVTLILRIRPWIYMSGDNNQNFRTRLSSELCIKSTERIYHDSEASWYSDIYSFLDHLGSDSYRVVFSYDNIQGLIRYYSRFCDFKFSVDDQIHLIAISDSSGSLKAYTWEQIKSIPSLLKDLKSYKNRNSIIRFRYDPYTGREINWYKFQKLINDINV